MADPGKLSLEVLIRTIADSRGIKTTDADISALAKTLDKATKSGEALSVTAADIEQGLKDQAKASTKAEDGLKGAGDSVDDLRDHQQGLARVALSNLAIEEQTAAKLRGTGAAAGTSADQLNQLKRSGGEVSQVLGGLNAASEGGTRGLLGMLTAGRGVVGMLRSLGSVLTGPVGLALGAAAAGIAYLGKITSENQATIEKWFAEAAKSSADLKVKYAEMDEAAKKSLDSQIAEVGRLGAAYQELLGMMDAAEQRVAKLNAAETALATAQLDRDEQLALAKAATPEAKAKVTESFAAQRDAVKNKAASAEIENEKLAADVRRQNAIETVRQQQRLIDNATVDARTKQDSFSFLKQQAEAAVKNHGIGSTEAHVAIGNSAVAKHAADLAESNRVKITTEATKALDAAQAQIDTANFTEKSVAIQLETLKATREAAEYQKLNQKAGTKLPDTGAAAAGIESTQAEKARLEEELRSRSGLSTDPRNVDLVAQIAAKNAALEKQNAELIGLQTRNATSAAEVSRAQLALQRATAADLAKTKRQQANARSSPTY